MRAVTHIQLRHGTRLAFEDGRLVGAVGRDGGDQISLAWDGDALVGLEVPAPPGDVAALVLGEHVPHLLFGRAHPVMAGGGAPVTWMGEVQWARPALIPPIEHPARLPGGAGTTILNVIARLAEAAGVPSLRYAGPYPTAALWHSLAQSFAPGGDPAAFTAGALERAARADMTPVAVDFVPAPFERVRVAPGVTVQLRDRVERVQVGGDTYAADGGVRRLIAVEDGGVAAEVWLGGAPWARIATVDARGALIDGPRPVPPPTSAIVGQQLPASLRIALAELVADQLAPPLAAATAAVLAELPVEWGDAGAAAARDRGDRVIVHAALWERLVPRGLAAVALALAEALAPPVAARAQARLAATLAIGLLCATACTAPPAAPVPLLSHRVPAGPRAEPPVLPLLADTLPAAFDRRARLARFDRVWLDEQAPIARRPDRAGLDNAEYVVVEERDDRVRLRVDDPWLRVLVWVQRDQLRPTLVRAVIASGHQRPIAPTAAIRLAAGAPLTLEPGPDGARITVDDTGLTAFATVPGDAIGDLWRTLPVVDVVGKPPGSLITGAEIRDAPSPSAQVLGRVETRLGVTADDPAAPPGWHLITVDTTYVSITGYAPDSAWSPGGGVVSSSSILPAHGDGVELPAGSCLYARPDGPLVGVVLVAQANATADRRGWVRWEWSSWWGRVNLFARRAGDRLESCPGTLPPT